MYSVQGDIGPLLLNKNQELCKHSGVRSRGLCLKTTREILNYLEKIQLSGRHYCCLHLQQAALFHLDFPGEATSSSPATEVHHLQG